MVEPAHEILAPLSLARMRVLKQGDTFAVFDSRGDIQSLGVTSAHGLYHAGTRFLSCLRLTLGNERPLLLGANVREDNMMLVVDMMNQDVFSHDSLTVPHGTLHLFRSKFLWDAVCHERICLMNFGPQRAEFPLRIEFGADFRDVFEVRGTRRSERGELLEPRVQDSQIELSYQGLDEMRRAVYLNFEPKPDLITPDAVEYSLRLQAGEERSLFLTAACHQDDAGTRAQLDFRAAYERAHRATKHSHDASCHVASSNELFNHWVRRSMSDLAMMVTETPHGPFPYAGVPWFSAPFGRDALISALATLWCSPVLSRGVLMFLAATQAERFDAEQDAQPGKILHEMRKGEMATLGEVPFAAYYGSVDSTPLFLMLAAQYHAATGDTETIQLLWPNIERALTWLDQADVDQDGFVEYGRSSRHGLIQQGWKDSHDSVFHADGSPAPGPIALCEVQGYAYAARLGVARLAQALGQGSRAATLEQQAARLKRAFDERFWCDDLGTYALALDGEKRPCRVRTSNAGHCLYTGIVESQKAGVLADLLLSDDLFSGWGVRTLATSAHRYNPLSYHNGSVWPHDNALIGAGLARYGFKHHACRIFDGMFEASRFAEFHRLPELYCGFARRPGEGPIAYPVACSPQAWAATVPLLLLQALLGLHVDGCDGRISFEQPLLPRSLQRVTLSGLAVGPQRVDIALHDRAGDIDINVLNRSSPRIKVTAVK